jgi:hypothetical protein
LTEIRDELFPINAEVFFLYLKTVIIEEAFNFGHTMMPHEPEILRLALAASFFFL